MNVSVSSVESSVGLRPKTIFGIRQALILLCVPRVFYPFLPKAGCTASWGGALEVGPSERVFRVFTIEVTSAHTLGNWYQFIKPTLRVKNLLPVKWFLNVVYHFIVVIFLSELCKPLFWRILFMGYGKGHRGWIFGSKGFWSIKVWEAIF